MFLSFTLSQAGMARRWWKIGHLPPGQEIKERGSTLRYEAGWQTKMVINGFGAVCTAVVMVVFAVTKFRDGAWMVVILIPALVSIFFAHPPPLQATGRPSVAGELRRRRRASRATG